MVTPGQICKYKHYCRIAFKHRFQFFSDVIQIQDEHSHNIEPENFLLGVLLSTATLLYTIATLLHRT